MSFTTRQTAKIVQRREDGAQCGLNPGSDGISLNLLHGLAGWKVCGHDGKSGFAESI